MTVEAGAKVDRAILCDGAVVKRGATVHKGCILSFGVVVGEGVVLPPFTRLTLSDAKEDDGFGSSSDDDDDDDDDDDETDDTDEDEDGEGSGRKKASAAAVVVDENWDVHLVGEDGKGKEWRPADEEEEDDDDDGFGPGNDAFSDAADAAAEELMKRLLSSRGRDIGATDEVS